MALITCPECGARISEFAESCPSCGCPARLWARTEEPKEAAAAKPLVVGELFELGTWDGEPLAWRVLDVAEGHALALCECAVDCRPFAEKQWAGNSWSGSSLKNWIANSFRAAAFSADEQATILDVTCLSQEEATRFFANDAERTCKPTLAALRRGTYVSESAGNCCWWLRTPSDEETDAVYVDFYGRINPYGCDITDSGVGVRPALKITRRP